jgi:NAD(P)H dehydrogenase (quinone)
MKHAVILAHPNPDSFNAAIARSCLLTLEKLGHETILRDLYALDFDPRLKREEVSAAHGRPAPDVVAERLLLADIESFIFIYPFWFNAEPAILKGYVDRVFGDGFGFHAGFGGSMPLLTGGQLTTISTSGAPDHWVQSTGALKALMTTFDLHVSAICGLAVKDHIHFGSIGPNLDEDAAGDVLDEVRDRLASLFGTAQAPAPIA